MKQATKIFGREHLNMTKELQDEVFLRFNSYEGAKKLFQQIADCGIYDEDNDDVFVRMPTDLFTKIVDQSKIK